MLAWSAPVAGCVAGAVGLVCCGAPEGATPACAIASCVLGLSRSSAIAAIACKSFNLTIVFSNSSSRAPPVPWRRRFVFSTQGSTNPRKLNEATHVPLAVLLKTCTADGAILKHGRRGPEGRLSSRPHGQPHTEIGRAH